MWGFSKKKGQILKFKAKDFDKVLRITKWAVVITPLFFGQLFNYLGVLDSQNSGYICELPSADYMKYLALQVGKSDMASYIPYSVWLNLNIIIMQAFAALIALYEIHIIIVNRKVHKKDSLFKKNKRAMLSFFSVLLLFYSASSYYVSVKKPQAIENVNFISAEIDKDLGFFASCSAASKITLSNERALIKVEKVKKDLS